MNQLSEQIIFLAVKAHQSEGKFNILEPRTSFDGLEKKGAHELEQTRQYLHEQLSLEPSVKTRLVDELLEINRTSHELTFEPNKENDGFVIDHASRFKPYFAEDGGGWDRLFEDFPNAGSIVTVSAPAYDDPTGIALIYYEMLFGLFGASEGSGDVLAYHLEGDSLSFLESTMIWMS